MCNRRYLWWAAGLSLLTLTAGCHATSTLRPGAAAGTAVSPAAMQGPIPRELCKVVLPTYVIEPPDILMIDAVRIVPRPPYRLRTGDVLAIHVLGTLPEEPIAGLFILEPGGAVRMGPTYGTVNVNGMTVEEAEAAIGRHLRGVLREPRVSVSLSDTAGRQQIAGEHLVGPDGCVTMGSYGSVQVVGMTLAQAKATIELHLSQFLDQPEISVDVYAYNSKVYYIVTQGAGMGDGVYRFPITGNETVLDAISNVNGLSSVSSKKIWIARPTDQPGTMQVLPVDWNQITAQAGTASNYQLMPGDRLFIAEDSLIALDTQIAKITAPLERVMGFSILGVGTATRFSGKVLRGGGNQNANF